MAKATDSETDRPDSPADDRVSRVLAPIIIGIVALSVVAIILYMIGTMPIGTANLWPIEITTVIWTVFFFGLPVAIILMIVVTIRLAVVRRRANQPPRR